MAAPRRSRGVVRALNAASLTPRRPARARPGCGARLLLISLVCLLVAFLLCQLYARSAYPIFFCEEVFDCAAQHGLSPYLVLAVVKAESGFDPTATSPRGARGLMQVMPDTGRWAAAMMGLEPFSTDALYDPFTNLRVGCWYLARLLTRYGGELTLALAAYNSGPTRVDAWREAFLRAGGDRGGVVAGDMLQAIPYGETRRFVARVRRDFARYRTLYQERFGEGER